MIGADRAKLDVTRRDDVWSAIEGVRPDVIVQLRGMDRGRRL